MRHAPRCCPARAARIVTTPDAVARLSVVHPQAFPSHTPEQLAASVPRLLALGLAGLEVTDARAAPVRDRLRQVTAQGAECVYLAGLPMLRARLSLCAEGDARAYAVRAGKTLVDDAAAVGASSILFTSGPDPGPAGRAAATRRLVASLTELCEHAAQSSSGVLVCLEPTDREVHHRQLIGPTAEALDVIDRLAGTGHRLGLNLDVSHLLQLGEDIEDSLSLASGCCRHVHLSNCCLRDRGNPLFGDYHVPFGYAGSEIGPDELTDVLKLLARLGYLTSTQQTLLGVEVRPLADADPWLTLGEALGRVRDSFDRAIDACGMR